MFKGTSLYDLRKLHKIALIGASLLIIASTVLYIISMYTPILVFPQVWSQHSPYGSSYEFKVNDNELWKTELETGFLSEIDEVVVTTPNGRKYDLERDYNINEYSGEVTRRFVLYGPPDGGLPESGEYTFTFIKDGETAAVKTVGYVQSMLGYPTDIRWERMGDDLVVKWTPPVGVGKENWYKVLVWDMEGVWETPTSLVFDWDASEGLLEDVPFVEDAVYNLNVAIFSDVGFAYSEYHFFVWDSVASEHEKQ
jgi:hypothetical protein